MISSREEMFTVPLEPDLAGQKPINLESTIPPSSKKHCPGHRESKTTEKFLFLRFSN